MNDIDQILRAAAQPQPQHAITLAEVRLQALKLVLDHTQNLPLNHACNLAEAISAYAVKGIIPKMPEPGQAAPSAPPSAPPANA